LKYDGEEFDDRSVIAPPSRFHCTLADVPRLERPTCWPDDDPPTLRPACTPGVMLMTCHGSRAVGIFSSTSLVNVWLVEAFLVSTAGGTAEIVNDAEQGLIVPCGDVSGLAVAIERTLLEQDLTPQRVASARRRVETSLSFDQRVAAVERIYAGLAERYPRPAGRRVTARCA